MKEFENTLQLVFTHIGKMLEYFLGGYDGLLYSLITFVVINYITSVMYTITNHSSYREIGLKEIFRKVLIFLLVGLANILDVQIIGSSSILRIAVVFFYISHEGMTILENANRLGLPIPMKLKTALVQLHDRAEDNKTSE